MTGGWGGYSAKEEAEDRDECEHGSLRRKCDICALTAERESLRAEVERLRDDRERRHPKARDAVTPKERAVQVQSDMDESFKRAIKTGQSLAKLHQPLRHEAVDIIERAISAAVAEEREQIAMLVADAKLDWRPLKGRDALAFAIRARARSKA